MQDADADLFAVLDDPQRRKAYLYVRSQHRSLTRDDVAAGLGISRSLAAFHLDRLLEAGLLHAHYARPEGRGGPGAGRPAKQYQASELEVRILIPERRYDLAGQILAEAVEGTSEGDDVRSRISALARDEGHSIGANYQRHHGRGPRTARRQLERAAGLLGELGFEPVHSDPGEVVLANCPFQSLVEVAPTLICGLNAEFVSGLLEGLGVTEIQAFAEPGERRCCVRVRAREPKGDES